MKKILLIMVALLVLAGFEHAEAFGPNGEGKAKGGHGEAGTEISQDEIDLVMEMDNFFKTNPTEMMWFVQAWKDEKWVFKSANLYGNVIVRQFAKKSDSPHAGEVTDTLSMEIIYKTTKDYSEISPMSFTEIPTLKGFMGTYTSLGKEQCGSGYGTKVVSENANNYYPSIIFTTSCDKYKESGLPGTSLHKIVKGKYGIYHLSRARAASSLSKKKVATWSKGFDKIKVCDNGVKDQKCPKPKAKAK